ATRAATTLPPGHCAAAGLSPTLTPTASTTIRATRAWPGSCARESGTEPSIRPPNGGVSSRRDGGHERALPAARHPHHPAARALARRRRAVHHACADGGPWRGQ